jgi:SAM-dependent methyltransferase
MAETPVDKHKECYQGYDEYGLETDEQFAQFDRIVREQHEKATPVREEIKVVLASTAARGVVLEVGSGRGRLAGIGGADYLALDYSLSLLERHLNGHRRVCANAEAIPLSSGSCRAVFSWATLEHVLHPDLSFAEIDRVLVPGGIAWLNPAWHCRDWAADGLGIRPYRDLTAQQKIRKALIPLRESILWRGGIQVPWRVWRRMTSKRPSRLRYQTLRANYEHFWVPDSDACAAIDSHEGLLFFESRGYEVLEPKGGTVSRLLARGGPIVVRKTS